MELIESLRKGLRPALSVRKAAEAASISEGRWRSLAKGTHQVSKGTAVPTRAPADTLARMARVVGATPDQLREVGREDAAGELEVMGDSQHRPTLSESRKARIDRLIFGAPHEDDPDLDFILTTLQTAVGMLQKRELWMAIQLINQSSRDLSDYLDTKEPPHAVPGSSSAPSGASAQAPETEEDAPGDRPGSLNDPEPGAAGRRADAILSAELKGDRARNNRKKPG